MFATIVWATDGSESADSTLRLVTELADLHRSKIVAVHVNEFFHGGRFGGPLYADEEEVEAKISGQVADLRAAGFEVEQELVTTRRHDRAALIAETAAKAGADLIVVGTHGDGALGALLHASVTDGLHRKAHCPVLVVPPLARMAVDEGAPLPAAVGA